MTSTTFTLEGDDLATARAVAWRTCRHLLEVAASPTWDPGLPNYLHDACRALRDLGSLPDTAETDDSATIDGLTAARLLEWATDDAQNAAVPSSPMWDEVSRLAHLCASLQRPRKAVAA